MPEKTAQEQLDEVHGRIDTLIEDYQRRLKTANDLLAEWEKEGLKDRTARTAHERVKTKASGFRRTLSELNRLK